MTSGTETSLAAGFAALQAERARSWSEAQLAQNLAQRRALLDGFDPAAAVQPGDAFSEAAVRTTDGRTIDLAALSDASPVILILFRFATCPADNIALPHYDRELRDAGIPVIAISPQTPDKLEDIRLRHGLSLTVANDPDKGLAHRLGLVFTPLDTPDPPPAGWIGEVTGTGTWELPLTSLLIVDRRTVRFVAVSPDWLDRIDGAEVRAALARLLPQEVN